jgi:hypothetical protein
MAWPMLVVCFAIMLKAFAALGCNRIVRFSGNSVFAAWVAFVTVGALPVQAGAVSYDIVYARQARYGDDNATIWPEEFHPARIDRGADLMLLHPDGTEDVLVAGGNGAVTDPTLSFDAEWCYYSRFPDVRVPEGSNSQRGDLPYAGSDIYRIHLRTREIQRLTHQEFTPNTGAGRWHSDPVNPPAGYNRLGYGILNMGPCPLPGGRIAFTSNRNGMVPTKGYTNPTLQLFVMDEDGQNVEFIAPMNIGSALHPTVLADGRMMFSSFESQGLRDSRVWGIWAIQPDGRAWNPIVSAFHEGQAFHFMTQLGNGDLVVCDYYNLNNNGFGALYRMPAKAPAGQPAFYSAFMTDAPPIEQYVNAGYAWPFKFPFQPRGMYSITPFTTGEDGSSPKIGGKWMGKFTHPSAAPNNDLLVVWSPTPANNLNRPSPLPYYDAGLYLIPGGNMMTNPSQMVLIKNSPAYNEAWPRAVVPYKAIHGVVEPKSLPWLPNDGSAHAQLPAGTAFGLIGTSSFYKRESFPGWGSSAYDGLDSFNTEENDESSNWGYQGSDAGKYSNADIWAVRVLAMEGNTHRSYGPNEGTQFYNHANERLRILGEIPLRKFTADGSPVLDPEGNPDTSFLAKIPSDTPFTFQTLDRDGLVLNMAQTWHQVRPGEARYNCGGCHAHSQQPLAFEQTAAGKAGYDWTDLTSGRAPLLTKNAAGKTTLRFENANAVNVEFFRDIRPILTRSCAPCHKASDPAGNLVLDDLKIYAGSYDRPAAPGDYRRLAFDTAAQWGYKPVIPFGQWRQSNASRYVRMFQSRRSLLIWKIFGRRLDGWSNMDHPTETVPGDKSTLPAGANYNVADLDYTGDIMPPPQSNVPALSEDEKMLFARWVDLGCPINNGQISSADSGALGWFADDNRPTLTVSSPRANVNGDPLSEIRVGVADAYTGIKPGSLSIKATFAVNGVAAGSELSGLAQEASPGVYSILLVKPVTSLAASHIVATVADNQGNITTKDIRFSVSPDLLKILELNSDKLGAGILKLRFFDSKGASLHRILTSLELKSDVWEECTFDETQPDHLNEAFAEISLPSPGSQQRFFRIVR